MIQIIVTADMGEKAESVEKIIEQIMQITEDNPSVQIIGPAKPIVIRKENEDSKPRKIEGVPDTTLIALLTGHPDQSLRVNKRLSYIINMTIKDSHLKQVTLDELIIFINENKGFYNFSNSIRRNRNYGKKCQRRLEQILEPYKSHIYDFRTYRF